MSWVDDLKQMSPTTGLDTGGTLSGSGGARTDSVNPSDLPPVPPPPAPRGQARKPAKPAGWVARLPVRYQLIGGAALVVAATVVFTRMFVHPVDEQAIAASASQAAVQAVRGELGAAKAEATQIVVPAPFSWAKCPVSNEAQMMITGDPATGGKTLNPALAGPVDAQAQQLLTAFTLEQLRLASPQLGVLRVVADDPTAGVALFACRSGNEPPATSTTVAVAAG